MPAKYTFNYVYEFRNGVVNYKRTVATPEKEGFRHTLCSSPQATRKAVLRELFDLAPDATLRQIVNAPLNLPVLPSRPLKPSKLASLAKKYPTIPRKHRSYYPSVEQLTNADDGLYDSELLDKVLKPSKKKVKQSAPPPKPTPAASQSILKFFSKTEVPTSLDTHKPAPCSFVQHEKPVKRKYTKSGKHSQKNKK